MSLWILKHKRSNSDQTSGASLGSQTNMLDGQLL
jgi:hypothetical protein